MRLTEPATLATDYLLSLTSAAFAIALARGAGRERKPVRFMILMFAALALASATGGTFHGFSESLSSDASHVLWKTTMLAVGLASFSLAAAGASATLRRRPATVVIALAAVKLLIFVVLAMRTDSFALVVYDYLPTLALVLLLSAMTFNESHARWITAGLLVSLVAAWIQQQRIGLTSWFNHNDLYHVIQLAGNSALFLGARAMANEKPSEEPPE